MKNLRLCWAAFGLCVSLGVSAQRGSCGTGVSWALADGTLTISGEGNMTDFTDPRYGSSNLPSWDIYKDNIVKVVIEGGVKHVGSYAFYDYSNLQAVTFAEGVKSIGSSAFYGCEGIKELLFPSSMKIISGQHNTNEDAEPQVSTFGMGGTGTAYMSSEAFRGCAGLTSVTIPRGVIGVGSGTFYDCRNLKSVYWDVADYPSYGFSTANENGFRDYGTQGSSPFSGCRLKEVVFGSEVDSIPGGLLYGQSELSAIKFSGKTEYVGKDAFKETVWFDNLPNGLVYIDKAAYAFKGLMSTPTAISIAEGTKSITEGLFANQTYLTKVTVPSTLTYMGYEVFEGCRSLGEVEWNAEDCKFGQTYGAPFSATALYTITFGEKVRKIPDGLCSGCRYITEVKMPASVVEVGESAFSDCSGLEAVGFSENMTSIEARAFLDCAKLSELILPNSLREIGENAFSGCTGLETLSIPESVDSIGRSAFYNTGLEILVFNARNCMLVYESYSTAFPSSVRELEFGDVVECIPKYMCSKMTNLVKLKVGRNVREMPSNCFSNCKNLETVEWNAVSMEDAGTPFASSVTQITFGKDVERIPENLCSKLKNLTSVVLPESLKEIGGSAFSYTGLKSVHIPDRVKSIESYVFEGCEALKEAVMGKEINYIGYSAFNSCSALENIVIPENVDSIAGFAFSDCSALTSIVIPDNVEVIDDHAFSDCEKLVSLTMGKKVRKIDYRAFDDCTALDSVYWNAEAFRGNGSEGVLPHTFRKIVFGESVEYVPVGLCKDNANLTMVKMGSHIRTIGASAFKQCTALKEVVLPPDVASIEESAFYGCTALQAVDFPASLEYIGNTAFANTGLTSLFILSTVKSFGTYAFSQNKELEWVVIAKDPFQHPNGLFGSCDKLQAIYLPDGINFYENYGWSYYGDKIRPIALYNGHEHVYNGYYPDMTCAINIPDGYEFKEMKVEGDIPTGVGEYEIPVTFTFTGTRNFEILSPYRCTIYPKELSVKAKDCTKIYGEKNPEFELEYDGFVEGEDASVLTELPVASCDATETSVADTIYGYPIYLSGGKADNYTFVFTGPGKLYIAPASQFITWDQDLSNLHVGDKVALEASSTSGQLVTFGLAEGDEELAMLHWSDGIGTLECLGEGTVTLTACQYSSDRNYKNAEPVVKILTISKADGIGAEKVSSMEVYGLHGHIRVRGMKAGLPLRVYTSDGVLLHEETCDGSNMDLAVPCSGLYLVKAGDKTVKLIMK